ncbi:MAG TPA: GIY-YIG nuclease family protein [Pyrinomonadaceae bacterium]
MQPFSIVYVLSNPAMPGLVKIGRTSNEDASIRIAQLYTTGVPVPFTIEFAGRVQNAEEVEKALHIAFAPNRVNPKREFFRIDPEQAIAILKLLHTEDATTEISQQPTGLDQQSLFAAENLKSRRPPLNFDEMGIPVGAVLQSTHDETTVTVISPKKVSMGDEEMSLTAATRRVLGLEYSVAPSPHWTCQGRLLREIYEETYGEAE